jgi:hypothetical protein
MKMSSEELQKLLDLAPSFIGQPIKVVESISRGRNTGKHDRHFATRSYFSFTVENVVATFSGAQLCFMGVAAQYGVSLDSVVSFKASGSELEIVEHFEQQTERQTHITAS